MSTGESTQVKFESDGGQPVEPCDGCGKTFETWAEGWEHMRVFCNFCQAKTTCHWSMLAHNTH